MTTFTVDPALLITPLPSVGFQITPIGAFGIAGKDTDKDKASGNSVDTDISMQSIGVTGGLTVFL
jgi:hypothetical protein